MPSTTHISGNPPVPEVSIHFESISNGLGSIDLVNLTLPAILTQVDTDITTTANSNKINMGNNTRLSTEDSIFLQIVDK